MNFTPWSGSNFRAAVSSPTFPSPIRSVRGSPRFWYFLARDHEAQVALHQLLHGLLVTGAHLPGERDLLLLGEEWRLRHLVEVLVEDVALVLMGPEAGEQTPTAPALLRGLRLRLGDRRAGRRHGGDRDRARRPAGLRPGGGGGLLPSDVLGHSYKSRITR